MSVLETTLTIGNRVGLHARPAALFVELSNSYECIIRVSNTKGEEANGKSILGILGLDIGPGEMLSIRTEGEDAKEAMSSILALFDTDFGETD